MFSLKTIRNLNTYFGILLIFILVIITSLLITGCFGSASNTPKVTQNDQEGNNTFTALAASDSARATLKSYIENVTLANAKKYGAKDNVGHTMDCAKIIQNPSGGYIAVYHTYYLGVPKVNLATSTDLMNWTWIRELAGSGNGGASQPTIKASGSAFIMAWEQEPNNHVKVVYFNSWTDLRNGVVAKSYDCPRQLSIYAEGTPNIYSGNSSSVDIGFHYYRNGDVDRQARGTCYWNSWSSSAQTNFDNAILYWGVQGNIGDRDGYAYFQGYNFGLIEGQYIKGDFGSWRSFIYDYQTGNAEQLNIKTNAGSTAFANPTITMLTINGRNTMLCTLFLPSEGAKGTESGELIYYRYY